MQLHKWIVRGNSFIFASIFAILFASSDLIIRKVFHFGYFI